MRINILAALSLTAALSSCGGGVVTGGSGSTAAAHEFIYVANGEGSISAYGIDSSTGALTTVPGSPFSTAGNDTRAIAVDPNGKFAYAVNYCGSDPGCTTGDIGTIAVFSINSSSGVLSAIAGSPFSASSGSSSVTVDPSGKFVYVTNPNSISAYTIDTTSGVLSAVPGSPFAAVAPYSITIDPSGTFAYAVNPTAKNVSVYTINPSTGALAPVTTGGAGSCGVIPDPGNCFASGNVAFSFAIDSSGSFAYMTSARNPSIGALVNGVLAFSIDRTSGALTAVSRSPFSAGGTPYSVAVDPGDMYVYVANEGSDNVSAYSIDASSGALTAIPGSLYGTGNLPNAVTVDPSEHFVYVANGASNNVSAYSIDRPTGILSAIPGSPFVAGSGPDSIAIVTIP